MTQNVERHEVVRMLAAAAEANGLDLRSFYDLGRQDRLDNPVLRDLWLIWGDVLTEDDLPEPASAA